MWVINRSQQSFSQTRSYFRVLLASFVVILSLSACVKMNDPEGSQEFTNHIVGEVDQIQTVGQSFVSRRELLNGITLWVTTKSQQDAPEVTGQLVVKLFQSSTDTQPIDAMSLTISPEWENSQVEITFPPQIDLPDQSYYVQIESTGGTVQLHGRKENAYENGTAFLNGAAIAADLAFRLTYDYDSGAVLQDLGRWGSQVGLLIPLGLTIYLPGWVLLDLTGQRRRYEFGEQAALSVGLSLAIIPLLMLWSTILHIRWSRPGILWVLGFLAGFYFLRLLLARFRPKGTVFISQVSSNGAERHANVSSFLTGLALIGIVGGAFFVRLAMVRDLATPAWVDSVHHAMITKIIMWDGNYPSSYEPYMEFDVYNYHLGFHSGLAVFTWLSGLEIPDALLIYGQALNALAALAVYLLTTTFTRRPLSGLFAAFVTSFLTPMPAYYTSWGRYTQLAGLLILPPLITLLRSTLHHPDFALPRRRIANSTIILSIIAICGLFLVHYRVIAFAFLLLVADFIASIQLHRAQLSTTLRQWLTVGFICILGFLLLTFPWLFPTLSHIFLPKLSPPESTQAVLFGDFAWRFLTTAYGKQALTIAGLGLILALFKKPRFASVIIIWVVLLLFFSNLDALKLPGGGFITGTSVVIMLFIPISILGGYFLDELISTWQSALPLKYSILARYAFWVFVTFTVTLTASFGARQLLPIINPITILSRQSDRTALDWISQNLPQESTFLINSFSWGFGLYAGSDGGYWISPLTGARSLPPPALYGLGNPDTVGQINIASQLAASSETTPLKLQEMMLTNKIDYLFIGVRGGPLSLITLMQSGLFEQIYHADGVWILKVQSVH